MDEASTHREEVGGGGPAPGTLSRPITSELPGEVGAGRRCPKEREQPPHP